MSMILCVNIKHILFYCHDPFVRYGDELKDKRLYATCFPEAESMESNYSMIEKISPKGVSFSYLICTCAVSISNYLCIWLLQVYVHLGYDGYAAHIWGNRRIFHVAFTKCILRSIENEIYYQFICFCSGLLIAKSQTTNSASKVIGNYCLSQIDSVVRENVPNTAFEKIYLTHNNANCSQNINEWESWDAHK